MPSDSFQSKEATMSTLTNEASLAETIRLLAVEMRGLREALRETGLLPTASRPQLRAVEAGEQDDS
jgi:hypothetical protein